MCKIKNRLNELQRRKEIPKYEKIIISNSNSNVVRSERKKEYEYYICDYCRDEIRIDRKQSERNGGIVDFPQTLTKRGKITLVLCNKCLNKAIKEFVN